MYGCLRCVESCRLYGFRRLFELACSSLGNLQQHAIQHRSLCTSSWWHCHWVQLTSQLVWDASLQGVQYRRALVYPKENTHLNTPHLTGRSRIHPILACCSNLPGPERTQPCLHASLLCKMLARLLPAYATVELHLWAQLLCTKYVEMWRKH